MASTLPQIDLINALTLYCTTNGQSPIVNDDNCWKLPNGQRTGYQDLSSLIWNHPSLVAPTANQLITVFDNWITANAALDATETTVKTAQNGLKSQIALAEQFASSIVAVLNASLQQTVDATTQPTRFNNIKAVMDAQPAAFRNRFNGDLLQETGIIIASILPADFPNYCRYTRQWSTQLALLLVIRKALS